MVDFKSMKKSSADIDRLAKEIEKLGSNENAADDRFWQPEVDKSGNGLAVIRFLPAPAVDGEDALPWVRVFSHGFKGPTGKWYIENCLTTLNQKDPVAEMNSRLWGESEDDNSSQRKQARAQKRKLSYISNIQVLTDSKNPENEGKTKLYRYGKKIFDKITLAMNPEFEGDEPINPFNFWTGANFKLRIRQVEGYRNYDQSSFDAVSVLNKDDAYLENLWKQEYSLKEFLDPKNFKTYDALKARLDEVLGTSSGPAASAPARTKSPVAQVAAIDNAPVAETTPAWADSDDDDMKYFRELADA